MPEYAVRRRPVPAMPHVQGYDYADRFEVALAQPDAHSAEQWVRTALERSHPLLRRLIEVVHAHVLRFELGPADEQHVLGWRIASAEPDLLQLQTGGALGRAVIVAQRTSPTTAVATTYVFFIRPAARVIWTVVGPLHRRAAPYLLRRAARTLVQDVGGRDSSYMPSGVMDVDAPVGTVSPGTESGDTHNSSPTTSSAAATP